MSSEKSKSEAKADKKEASQGLPSQEAQDAQGELYAEYMKLLAGGRVSSRRSQVQSVTERKRQE